MEQLHLDRIPFLDRVGLKCQLTSADLSLPAFFLLVDFFVSSSLLFCYSSQLSVAILALSPSWLHDDIPRDRRSAPTGVLHVCYESKQVTLVQRLCSLIASLCAWSAVDCTTVQLYIYHSIYSATLQHAVISWISAGLRFALCCIVLVLR